MIAALAAFSYAGFNLSNLAIVAGALSVGIGFGLQSVVNNFVSGLILLAERPIKVGDLVVVGGEEGYVRKISVRSTEVETFDRARVLIPNSYFITEKVKNWTLRDNIRRIVIPVGVAYGCDPRQAKAILLKVAQDNPNVMSDACTFRRFRGFRRRQSQFQALRVRLRPQQSRQHEHGSADRHPRCLQRSRHRNSVSADRRHAAEHGLAARGGRRVCLRLPQWNGLRKRQACRAVRRPFAAGAASDLTGHPPRLCARAGQR